MAVVRRVLRPEFRIRSAIVGRIFRRENKVNKRKVRPRIST